MSSFKHTILGHNADYYVQKGAGYLKRAEQQHQNKCFSEAQRLRDKAQHTFKIWPSERAEAVNRALAQAWLSYGDCLRDLGELEKTQASYEAAQAFDRPWSDKRLKTLDLPKSNIPQNTASQMMLASTIQTLSPASLSPQKQYFQFNPAVILPDEDISSEPRDIRNTYHLARSLRNMPSTTSELNTLADEILNFLDNVITKT
ncbi:hypothetical protein K457DRAFT_26553 [Linnemannia elongata AG-77]|uniref:TPR-like protein n=1 Tax=Linnemannia elongata AG-77 TaxID=1314771 RepID=A0A197JBU4_9FUNG|nr:hypothetical protein K457DRAFT_26553 [Linnemannia elongata AG-77]